MMKQLSFAFFFSLFGICHSLNAQWVYNYHDQADTVENNILYFERYDLTAFFYKDEVKIETSGKYHLEKVYKVKDSWSISRSYQGDYRLLLDDVEYNWIDSSGWVEKINNYPSNTIRIHKQELLNESALSFERISDDMVIVNEFKADSVDPFAEPLKSIQHPEEDSLIFDEYFLILEAVYPPLIPGYERSGVFNYKTGNWLIKPEYQNCQLTSNGYLLIDYLRDSIHKYSWDILYGFINFNGEVIYSKVPIEYAINDEVWLGLISDKDNVVSVKKQLSLDRNYNKNPELFAVDNFRNQFAFKKIHNGHYFENIQLTKPVPFVHYNPDFDFIYWVNNDSIYLDWNGQVFITDLLTGKIELKIDYLKSSFGGYSPDPVQPKIISAKIIVYAYDDTLISDKEMIKTDEPVISVFSNINYQLNKLVVNDYSVVEFGLTVWNEYGPLEDKINHHFESENSSVWTKNDGVWTKSTTNYATIEPVPFGYVVSTPKIYQEAHENQEAIDQPKRYLLLDANLRAIPFMDFFDFEEAKVHAFGVSLKTDTGRFLVNNQGKAVSNAEWDKFQLVDGEVIAIRFKAGTTIIEKQMVIDLGLR